MKYVIGVLALLLAMGVASAEVQIWGNSQLYGTSQFTQLVQNGGPNWQKVGDVLSGAWAEIPPTTAAVDMQFSNQITNTGTTIVQKYVDTQGDWNVRGIDSIGIIPYTTSTPAVIQKGLLFDTNSKYVVDTPNDPNLGKLAAPTHMIALDYFKGDAVNTYDNRIDVLVNLPPAQTWNSFGFIAQTDQPLAVSEIFGKNLAPIKAIPTNMPTLNLNIDP